MRVLIDEDSPTLLLAVLQHVLPTHRVDHVTGIGWSGKKDRFVLADAKKIHYHVVLTRDRNQLDDPDECDAIKKSGLHHVRYSQRRHGMVGLALAVGAVVAAMPQVMEALESEEGQRLVRIAGIDPHRRFVIADPNVEPPSRYWPR